MGLVYLETKREILGDRGYLSFELRALGEASSALSSSAATRSTIIRKINGQWALRSVVDALVCPRETGKENPAVASKLAKVWQADIFEAMPVADSKILLAEVVLSHIRDLRSADEFQVMRY